MVYPQSKDEIPVQKHWIHRCMAVSPLFVSGPEAIEGPSTEEACIVRLQPLKPRGPTPLHLTPVCRSRIVVKTRTRALISVENTLHHVISAWMPFACHLINRWEFDKQPVWGSPPRQLLVMMAEYLVEDAHLSSAAWNSTAVKVGDNFQFFTS